eukprot:COSAG03_NODE_2519_length_2681_cov_13.054609_3_plen_132_part_00
MYLCPMWTVRSSYFKKWASSSLIFRHKEEMSSACLNTDESRETTCVRARERESARARERERGTQRETEKQREAYQSWVSSKLHLPRYTPPPAASTASLCSVHTHTRTRTHTMRKRDERDRDRDRDRESSDL